MDDSSSKEKSFATSSVQMSWSREKVSVDMNLLDVTFRKVSERLLSSHLS